jgi:serine/threonine protein kinase
LVLAQKFKQYYKTRTDVWALGCCLYSLAFLQNCFEEGSNLAILSRKYTIPDDNPYGDGLVELIDRMLAVDYKARADMTEVILCLSAVYSGRPLPPRKKNTRSLKSDEKESSKKTVETTQKETIGKFRIDSQGYQENLYDPTKATEAKKLASNSVAARRKRAAASSSSSSSAVTSKITGGPSATIATATAAPTPAPASVGLPSSQDPLTFSSIQGSEENNTSDVAFSSFGDLSREFSTSQSKGDVDFFQAFDNAKEGQKPKGNDGFDANDFGATGWDEKADGNGINKVQSSSTNKNDNFDSNGEKTKKDGSDNPRTKSRRKREGGGRSRANRDVEAGMETLKINNNDNAGAGAGAGASRRSRSSRGEEDKESRLRKRSGSRSRRKARGPRTSATKIVDETGISGDDDEKKPLKANSIRNIFNRKQGSQDP